MNDERGTMNERTGRLEGKRLEGKRLEGWKKGIELEDWKVGRKHQDKVKSKE